MGTHTFLVRVVIIEYDEAMILQIQTNFKHYVSTNS